MFSYMEEYTANLPTNPAKVLCVTMALEGEAVEWLMALHDDAVVELHHFNQFMCALRKRFENLLTEWKAMTKIKTIRQGRQPIASYIHEFWSLASKLTNWLQDILIEYFQEGLSNKVFHTCLSHGSPRTLQDWYILADEMEINLARYHD